MHHRFPNIVGGFDERIPQQLDALVARCRAAPIEDATGSVDIVQAPDRVPACATFRVQLRVQNRSGLSWRGTPVHPLNLSYHWRDDSGSLVVFDGVRTPGPSSGFATDAFTFATADVVAPEAAGTYRLLPCLVQEGVAWLDERGLVAAGITVVVNADPTIPRPSPDGA